jgi:hypothetical protein
VEAGFRSTVGGGGRDCVKRCGLAAGTAVVMG